MGGRVGDKVGDRVGDRMNARMHARVSDRVPSRVHVCVHDTVGDRADDRVHKRVRDRPADCALPILPLAPCLFCCYVLWGEGVELECYCWDPTRSPLFISRLLTGIRNWLALDFTETVFPTQVFGSCTGLCKVPRLQLQDGPFPRSIRCSQTQHQAMAWQGFVTSIRFVQSCFSSRATTSLSISCLRSRSDSTQMGAASGNSPAPSPPGSCTDAIIPQYCLPSSLSAMLLIQLLLLVGGAVG